MKNRILKICAVIFLAIALVGVVVYIAFRSYLSNIGRFDSNQPPVTVATKNDILQETVHEDSVETEETKEPFKGSEVINILLVGQPGKVRDGVGDCESIVLCTIRKAEEKIVLTSFHSDCLVEIPGLYNAALSASGKLGGIGLLNRTLEHNFGIMPDYNIVVNMSGFLQLIDALGGVSVDLLQGEADCLNEFSSHVWQLKEGNNLLTGEQAYHFSRMTQSNTDYGRNDRQKRILIALANSLKNTEIQDVQDVALEIARMISTDMTDEQILQLIVDVAPMLKNVQIATQSIPVEGQYTLTDENALLMSDLQLKEIRDLISQTTK